MPADSHGMRDNRLFQMQWHSHAPLSSLTPQIFAELAGLAGGVGGEIQLTDGIAKLLRKEKVFAFHYAGKRYDCGSKLGFLQATVDLAEQHAQVGSEFSQWLRNRPASHT